MTAVDMRPAVAFLIPSLAAGGAERQLLALASGLDKRRWRILVVHGVEAGTPHAWDVPDTTRIVLERKAPWAVARDLRAVLERHRVAVLHAYLLSSQFKSWLVRAWGWSGCLVIGVRDSLPLWYVRNLSGIVATAAVFGGSWCVDRYVFNSRRGALQKAAALTSRKRVVIANGIDVERFRPDGDARARLRALLGVGDQTPVVGMVANLTSYKDYPTFIEAARLLSAARRDVHVAALGDDTGPEADRIRRLASRAGLTGRLHFLGPRPDVERLVPGFDIACCSSATEGFPNAVAEAMACGVPCVVTDVGDAVMMVGDSGIGVPRRDPARLAQGLTQALAWTPEERAARGGRARQRIAEHFSIDRMVAAHDALYRTLLTEAGTCCAC